MTGSSPGGAQHAGALFKENAGSKGIQTDPAADKS
jgi:hypothetical protein